MSKHTKDKLADALRKVGLADMADRAAQGYYHDFLSPLATPAVQLVRDLTDAIHAREPDAGQVLCSLRKRVIDGDFDASEEESEAWAASEEGQEAARRLIQREQWRS